MAANRTFFCRKRIFRGPNARRRQFYQFELQLISLAVPGAETSRLIAEGLSQCTGEYVHILDDKTGFVWKNAYAAAIRQMEETKADAGCFGWLDEDGRNSAKTEFHGTGTGRIMAEAALESKRAKNSAAF